MNIAILHSAFTESGGAERVVLNQARNLKALGHKVTCYVAAVNRRKCFPEEISSTDIETFLCNLKLPKLEYVVSVSLITLLAPIVSRKLKGYDAIICHHQPTPSVAYQAFQRYGIPYISYIHHPPRFIYLRNVEKTIGWKHNWNMRILNAFEKRFKLIKRLDYVAITNAKAVLVNSQNIAKEVAGIYGVKPLVCYPGVDLPLSINKQTGDTLKKLGISKPFILSTSRHTPHKRLDWLITIAGKIAEELPEISLVLVGGFHPNYTLKLRQMAETLERTKIIFLNYITNEELSVLYQEASVYAFTAPDEDLGLGPIEAMQYGTPVVCWDDGAGPAETVQDGVVGFKVKPYDLKAFAVKIQEILNNDELRQEMGKKAKVYARQNFNWAKHAKTLEGLLQASEVGAK
jgi:glycosyltransferase involved in cell wall biosynthesis